ncbi:myb-like protein X [Palaemon carinicauda]|uniref:myb-like protein X n=1 Tax=Palaemon carinicauda TaxID=392227 RepID=UPI0035B6422B
MEEMENLIEDMNPWELAKNMCLASSQSSSSGIKGSTILRKAKNISSIFSKASRPFQKASLSDSNPLDPIQESGVHPESEEASSLSTTSTIKVKLEDLTTESFDGDSVTSGHGKGIANLWENKRSAMFSKASSSVPVLKKDQSKLGTVSDATISIDVLNCSPPMTLNSPSGDAKESNLSGDDAQKTFVPTVKKVPVFGGRKTQITKGALDKEDNSVPKKIPKFSSSVVKRAPPFVSNHSKSISQGNGGNKVSGSQLLKPSLQSRQSNRDVKESQMETDSLRKPNKETSSEDKEKETMKVGLTEISSITNESEAMQSNSSRLFFNTDKKENAKSHACESIQNGHEEIPKSITPKTNPKQNIKASAKTEDGKDKASKSKFLVKIDEKKSCSAPSIKKSETVRHVKLACDDKTSKSSSSASEQHLEKTSEICDGDKNKDVLALQDLENEESNVCVDSLLDEESSSMGEGHICKEAALEIPMNNKTPDSRSHLYCSKSQKQGLAMEIGNKNAEQVGSVSCNSDLKKEKKCISKTKFSPKKADKWDRIFRAVISQAMSADVNSQEEKKLETKTRNLKKPQKLKSGIRKKKLWTNAVLGNDEDKENISPESMMLKKRKSMKQVTNMKKRLKHNETVTRIPKLLQQQFSGSEASDSTDYSINVIQSPGTLAYKKELYQIVQRSYDSWVQCDSCSKWRKLPPNVDPASLPPKWTCEVNYNENQNTCSAPEEDWNKENVYVYNGFIVGSVVWARVVGTDWWPAMVDIDPDFQIHNWLDGSAKNVKYYNVTFFGDPVYRGWVLSKHILRFRTTDTHERFLAVNQKDSSTKFLIKKAVQEAHKALNMSVAERKKKYTFYSRYHGSLRKRSITAAKKVCEGNTLGFQENSSLMSSRDQCGDSIMGMIESKDKGQTSCKDPLPDKVRSSENGTSEFLKNKCIGKEQAASCEMNAEVVGIGRKDEERTMLSEKDSEINVQEKRDQNKDFDLHSSMAGTEPMKEKNPFSEPKITQDMESDKFRKCSSGNTEDSQLEENARNEKVSAKCLNMQQEQVEYDNNNEPSNNEDKHYEDENSLNHVSEVPSSDDELHDTIETIIRNLDMVQSQDIKSLPLIEDQVRNVSEDEAVTPRAEMEKRAIENRNSVIEEYKNKTDLYSPHKVFNHLVKNSINHSKTQKASKDFLNGCGTSESEEPVSTDGNDKRYSLKASSILPAMSQDSSKVSQEITIQYDQLKMNKNGH